MRIGVQVVSKTQTPVDRMFFVLAGLLWGERGTSLVGSGVLGDIRVSFFL